MLYFITGNKGKFQEAKRILPELEQLDIDLPEIQDIDPHNIIKAKLDAAFAHHPGPFIVEDTSLYLDCLNGLPGPLIKWFLKTVGNQGLYEISSKLGNNRATAKTLVGYAKDKDTASFFEGVIEGYIVAPTAAGGFGWDPIFQPTDHPSSFGQMTLEEKEVFSMRKIALEKLKAVL